jgi:hypothetical protein
LGWFGGGCLFKFAIMLGDVFENSDEASESDSLPSPHASKEQKPPQRISTALARRLTQDLIEYKGLVVPDSNADKLRREDSAEKLRSSLLLRKDSFGPGVEGLGMSSDENAATIGGKGGEEVLLGQPSMQDNGLRGSYWLESDKHSFSAPTSPTGPSRRHHVPKVGTLLGLTPSGLRKETVKAKKDIATRLQIESETYQDYVNQTVTSNRHRRHRASGGVVSEPLSLEQSASSNSMLLTSDVR